MDVVVELAQVTAPEVTEEVVKELGLEGIDVGLEQRFDAFVFTKKFQIEREKLFREDIRDLVKLTVERMDIYHLIGELLLSFCITFYCENQMLEMESEARIPAWCLTLFLLSNASAVGYLVFAVWLAMHAAVSASSVGVRLLTTVTRITAPEPEEVHRVTVKRLYKHILEKLKSKRANAATTPETKIFNPLAYVPEHPAGWNHLRTFHEHSAHWRAFDEHSRFCMFMGMNQMLQALSYYILGPLSILSPTAAVASLCGIQYLSALLLRLDIKVQDGRKFQDTYTALGLVPCPIFFAFLLTMLDQEGYQELASLLSLGCFALHAGWLYFVSINLPDLAVRLRTATYTAVLSEAQLLTNREMAAKSHGKSLGPMQREHRQLDEMLEMKLRETYPSQGLNSDAFLPSLDVPRISPPRLASQLGSFVAELKAKAADAVTPCVREEADDTADGGQECILRLKALTQEAKFNAGADHDQVVLAENALKRALVLDALVELEYQVHMAEKQELVMGSLQSSWRMDAEPVVAAIIELRDANSSAPRESAEARMAGKAHARVQFWRRAPRIYAEFKALIGVIEGGWVPDSSCDYGPALACAYQAFLAFCNDMSLGIKSTKDGNRIWSPMPVTEVPWVRVEMPGTSRAHSSRPLYCWVRPTGQPGAPQDETHDATGLDTISVEGFFESTLPNFVSCADQLALDPLPERRGGVTQSTRHQLKDHYDGRLGADGLRLESKACSPDPGLPRRLVTRFTVGGMFLWFVAACEQCSKMYINVGEQDGATAVHSRALGVSRFSFNGAARLLSTAAGDTLPDPGAGLWPVGASWPEPQSLFQIASMFCTPTHLVIGNGFELLVAERHSQGPEAPHIGPLISAGGGNATSLLCEDLTLSACRALVPDSIEDAEVDLPSRRWYLVPLELSRGVAAAWTADGENPDVLLLPAAWRLVASVQAVCEPTPCSAAWLAGWDGTEVVLALAARAGNLADAEWRVEERFAVRPGLGCAHARSSQTCRAERLPGGADFQQGYKDVRGLQLGSFGRTLTVLLGDGLLDGWDLDGGAFLGRWPLGGGVDNATAVCHDGRHLVVARRGSDGRARLEESDLPRQLRHLSV